jgi:hypothetical protein
LNSTDKDKLEKNVPLANFDFSLDLDQKAFKIIRNRSFISSIFHIKFMKVYVLIESVNHYGQESDGGIMVSIAAFQAVDPGSIPGHRIVFSFVYNCFHLSKFLRNKFLQFPWKVFNCFRMIKLFALCIHPMI